MTVVIKQCSNFFLGLSEYCNDYLNDLEAGNDGQMNHSTGKKLKTSAQGEFIATQGGKGKREKKAKAVIDPDMPRKPITPFFQFCAHRRDKIKAQYPKFSATEITQLISKEWKELPKEKIQAYQDKYKDMYREYKIKIEEYNHKKAGSNTKGSEVNKSVYYLKSNYKLDRRHPKRK